MTKREGRRSPPPSGNPRGSYRSPFSHPPTTYPYPPRNRSAEIITISLLVAAFLLLGLGGMLWLVQTRILFSPTPTPTPTQAPPLTSTPDFSATRVAEDFLTQQAYQMALLGTRTPTPMALASPTQAPSISAPELTNTPHSSTVLLPGLNVPALPSPEDTVVSEVEPLPTANPTDRLVLPVVIDNSPLATPTPAAVAELPTPEPTTTTAPATPLPEIPVETPTAIPTVTPTQPLATSSPTPTATLVPPTPTATAIPPGQPFVVGSLQGFSQDQGATLRLGPSNIYTDVYDLPPQTKVTILKRNPSGEWLQVCCIENKPDLAPTWVRQAFVRPRDNVLQNGAPDGSNPDDVRWLAIEAPPQYLPPMPTPVPPLPDDFPFARYDRNASGRVAQVPNAPFIAGWDPEAGRAGGPLVSPVAVMGQNVIVDSADNHLYSFDRLNGSQRWRFDFCSVACTQFTLAPLIYDQEIFIADQNQTVWDLQENLTGNGASSVKVNWSVHIDQPALTSLNVFSDTLFLATGTSNSDYTLLAMHRDNGAILWSKKGKGIAPRYPTIGDQLVYLADGVVTAYDVYNGQQAWVNNDVANISAGPVYGSPGISALAELYVVSADNRIYDLDANTGVELWNIDNGEAATSLALNADTLIVAGDSYVKAISRHDQSQRWRTPIQGGPVMGGPLVDNNRILIVTKAGNAYLLDSQSGSPIVVPSIAALAGGGPAVSGPYIFIPGNDGRLYELLTSQ